MWFKSLDTVNPILSDFREYCSSSVAPFLLDGVVYDPLDTLNSSSPPDLRPIPGLDPLLKFEVEYVDEADVTPNTIGWIALRIGSLSQQTRPKGGPPRPTPEEVARQRTETLRYHFPITLERLRRSSSLRHLMLQIEGIHPWQIEQALCNLVLSADIGLATHYGGLSARKVQARIIDALRSRFELADGVDLPAFSAAEVRTQAIADGNALLRHFNNKIVIDLASLQSALQRLSLLEASTAVAEGELT
jgi:hypothetical protein